MGYHKRLNKLKITATIAIGIVAITALIFIASGNVGIRADSIEADARKAQKVDDKWDVSISTNRELSAMIFYNDALDKYIYSIYINRDGLSWGYFFGGGGASVHIMDRDGVPAFEYADHGCALISMNKSEVARIELDNERDEINVIDIDPQKPFAVVLPKNIGSITLYNTKGDAIPLYYLYDGIEE
jgi:hypothetical protein